MILPPPPIVKKRVTSLLNLRWHIYVIGYPAEGETILMIAEDDGVAILAMLTDVYSQDAYCHVAKILQDWEYPSIDIFIWTHPDKDHSLGIENLLGVYDKNFNCHILIPENLHSEACRNSMKEDAKATYNYLTSNYSERRSNSSRFHQYHTVSWNPYNYDQQFYIEFEDILLGNKLRAVLSILAPDSQKSLQITDGTVGFDPNTISIVYHLDVNGIELLMTGDMNNYHAKQLSAEYLKNIRFIKLPHHTSSELKDFPDKLKVNTAVDLIGATTIYNSGSNHPHPDMIIKYGETCKSIYCTGTGNKKYGCIEVVYDMTSLSQIGDTQLTGNAVKLKVS